MLTAKPRAAENEYDIEDETFQESYAADRPTENIINETTADRDTVEYYDAKLADEDEYESYKIDPDQFEYDDENVDELEDKYTNKDTDLAESTDALRSAIATTGKTIIGILFIIALYYLFFAS